MGRVLADYADRPDESDNRSRSRCRQARVRSDDADEKDRHRSNRGGAPRLRLLCSTASVTETDWLRVTEAGDAGATLLFKEIPVGIESDVPGLEKVDISRLQSAA